MSENTVKDTTVAVIGRILGEAAFMFADPLDPSGRPDREKWEVMGVTLSFFGDKSGEFRFWAPASLAKGLAANMLGVNIGDDLSNEKYTDALKEIVNIIVGNFLTEMFGPQTVATLGLPHMINRAALSGDYGNPEAIWLSIDGEAILCIMTINAGMSGT